jgi:cell wall-associated NlpC family hydrolase
VTPEEIIARARKYTDPQLGLVIYRMGGGTLDPKAAAPWSVSPVGTLICDCSAFAMWVFGKKKNPALNRWLNTDGLEADIRSIQKHFRLIPTPEPGCLIVDGAGAATGHCGVVVAGFSTATMRVVDCSSQGMKHAITENHGPWFMRSGHTTVFGVPV